MGRKVQILTDGRYWSDAKMELVSAGMVYRLFEEDGREVADEDGHTRWRALADAEPSDSGKWRVRSEAIPESAAERAALRGAGYFPGGGGSGLRPHDRQGWRPLR